MENEITWDVEKYKRFRIAYNVAVANGWKVFTFEGNEFVTGYAKYLLEYLSTIMGDIAQNS